MRVIINTISKNVFDGEAERITIPTANGYISILDHHQPLTTIAKEGIIEIEKTDHGIQKFQIRNALIEITPNNDVTISADLLLT